MSETTENKTFRILYFIGIFLVVANHYGGGSIDMLYNWFPAYSFHLPLFMFCSGYLIFKNKSDKPLTYIKKNLKKLLIPLYFWNFIYGLFVIYLHNKDFVFGENFTFFNIFIKPIYDGHQFMFTLGTWFIFPLLILKLINYFIIKLFGENKKLYILYFAFSLLFGLIGVYMSMSGFNKEAYLLLDKVLIFYPFFTFGMVYNQVLERHDKCPSLVYLSIIFLINLIVIYIFGGTKEYVICWCNNFDNIYRVFIVGFIGILFWLRIAKIFSPILSRSKLIMTVSRNTYDIVIHHIMGCFLLNFLYYKLSNRIFYTFDVESFKSNVTYLYTPKGLSNFLILYVVFGIGFSLLIVYIKNFLKEELKKRRQ